MSRRALLLVAGVALTWGLVVGCAAHTANADKRTWKKGSTQKGKAVWYGGKWHGRKTASGERFDQNSMTAAHKSLPFNSIVRVTNLKNDRSVVVRINNRGPYGKGRIIDLAKAAAKKIKMINSGVVPARLEVLKVGDGARKKKKRKKRKKRKSS